MMMMNLHRIPRMKKNIERNHFIRTRREDFLNENPIDDDNEFVKFEREEKLVVTHVFSRHPGCVRHVTGGWRH